VDSEQWTLDRGQSSVLGGLEGFEQDKEHLSYFMGQNLSFIDQLDVSEPKRTSDFQLGLRLAI
jgi:hypothetical protein